MHRDRQSRPHLFYIASHHKSISGDCYQAYQCAEPPEINRTLPKVFDMVFWIILYHYETNSAAMNE